ncbi:MAG: polyprenyl synthetase family protein [Candidatus Paracaedibacter sp.]
MPTAALIPTNEKKGVDPFASLKALLQEDLKKVDQIIEHNLDSSVPLIPTMGRHLISAGGKRLRPLLTIACHRLFDKGDDAALGLAAAVEFIHTATLLHDDVIDESRLRRGLPTANAVWGNQPSVLVGDFLFARSFQLMVESNNSEVLKILANAAACIAEGEILQLSVCHNLEAKVEDALRVIEAKTATLFAAACQVGALMACQTTHAIALRDYGRNLGMAFQIVDDILDYCAQTNHLGKDVGDDFREGKITLPVILAYPHCLDDEKGFLKKTLIDHDQSPEDLFHALQLLHERQGIAKAYELATAYGEKARQALEPLPPHPIKDLLAGLIDHSLQRQC